MSYIFCCVFCCSPGVIPDATSFNDPVNSPIVLPFDLKYDEGQNAVVLEWEYLGIEPATRYQIWRRERDGVRGFFMA